MELTRTKNLIGATLVAAAIALAGVAYAAGDDADAASDDAASASHPNAMPGPHGSNPPGYTLSAARD